MNCSEVMEIVTSKDTKEIYGKFQELEAQCDKDNSLYGFFDSYLEAVHNKKACARGRAFKMIMRNARWDAENNLIDENIDEILAVLNDDNATVVRQCLPLLEFIGRYKEDLVPIVRLKLVNLNYAKYKESMQGLIQKDVKKILSILDK